VGDATYSPVELESVCNVAERMMLHSHILKVTLGSVEGLLDNGAASVIDIQAKDPFPIDGDGKIRVILPI
jgi:hypothetical protein